MEPIVTIERVRCHINNTMSFQLTAVLVDGIDRVLTRTGAILFAIFVATELLLVGAESVAPTVEAAATVPSHESSGLISALATIGLLLGILALTALPAVVAARALARPLEELSTFPAALYTRRIDVATLWMAIGTVVLFIAVAIGLALFVVPGLILAAATLFFGFAVAVEDRGIRAAFGRSWVLARGNLARLVVLVVVLGLVVVSAVVVPAQLSRVAPPAVVELVTIGVSSAVLLVSFGIVAAAYLRVQDACDFGSNPEPDSDPNPETTV